MMLQLLHSYCNSLATASPLLLALSEWCNCGWLHVFLYEEQPPISRVPPNLKGYLLQNWFKDKEP